MAPQPKRRHPCSHVAPEGANRGLWRTQLHAGGAGMGVCAVLVPQEVPEPPLGWARRCWCLPGPMQRLLRIPRWKDTLRFGSGFLRCGHAWEGSWGRTNRQGMKTPG